MSDQPETYFQWCEREGIDRETAKAALWQLRLLNNRNATYWDAFSLARRIQLSSAAAKNTAATTASKSTPQT